jgi:hypothetical protein
MVGDGGCSYGLDGTVGLKVRWCLYVCVGARNVCACKGLGKGEEG